MQQLDMPRSDRKATSIAHVLSVDVEDYFQVEAFADVISPASWDRWPSRVVENTRRVLDLFEECEAQGTFFFVGWIAERFPFLVREVASRGHELACHSYWHQPVYRMTPAEFREDTRRAREVIEQAGGAKLAGYRAPTWSITKTCLWALDILAEEGFAYDSSIYPISHDLYGVPQAPRFRHTHACGNGLQIEEFPPATVRVGALNLPAAGGGYLRIFPLRYTLWALKHIEKASGQPAVVYLHPWEIDSNQPRIAASFRSRFRHYTNISRMQGRVATLLRKHRFQRFCDLIAPEKGQGAGVSVELPSVTCGATEMGGAV
jgi:polysaccharide deacetylase family protein (PEP-CTERM system associated)